MRDKAVLYKLFALALVLLAVFAVSAMIGQSDTFASVTDPLEDSPDPGDDGTGGCNYCDQTACGCASPPVGCTLIFSCYCAQNCGRTCTYEC